MSEENISERGHKAKEVLGQLLELSRISVDIDIDETDERIGLDIVPHEASDADLIYGRQGRTLAAYQFVTNRIVNRFPEDRKPIGVDVSGFVTRHRGHLEELAARLGASVLESDVEVSIVGMNPAERRTVHMAVSNEQGVKTVSQDEGIARRLIVTPS